MARYFSTSSSENDSSRMKKVSSRVARSAKVTIQSGVGFFDRGFFRWRQSTGSRLPLGHQTLALFRGHER